MRNTIVGLTLLTMAAGAVGCSFHARSPEKYEQDTRAVLESNAATLKACYDGVLRNDPNAGGNVVVRFDVQEKTGAITQVAIDETQSTAPQPVSDCVYQSLQGLVLEPPDARLGKATFSYEFTIAPPAPAAPPAG